MEQRFTYNINVIYNASTPHTHTDTRNHLCTRRRRGDGSRTANSRKRRKKHCIRTKPYQLFDDVIVFNTLIHSFFPVFLLLLWYTHSHTHIRFFTLIQADVRAQIVIFDCNIQINYLYFVPSTTQIPCRLPTSRYRHRERYICLWRMRAAQRRMRRMSESLESVACECVCVAGNGCMSCMREHPRRGRSRA